VRYIAAPSHTQGDSCSDNITLISINDNCNYWTLFQRQYL